MKYFFISPFCLLRPTTNRIFDVRFCDLLAGTGADVTLIHPYYYMKENLEEKEVAASYGINHDLKFRMLKTPLNNDSARWWQVTMLLISFFFSSVKIIFENHGKTRDVCVITRDNKSALPLMLIKKILGRFCRVKIVNTVHEVKGGKLNRWMYRNYDGILVTTPSAKTKLVQKYFVAESRIDRLVAPVSAANYSCSKTEARRKINFDGAKPLAVYTGKLGKGIKELDYILDAAELLPQYNFILTGGKEEAVVYFKELCRNRKIANVSFPGFLNDSTFISYYQLAADVLISYYTKADHIVEYNFPQKLVEYMFSHNPIVTPDFPATHDLINSSNAVMVEPDNPVSLAAGIKQAVENTGMSKKLAEKAFDDVQQFSFEKRAEHLVHFLTGL
ncbi:MAG: glycosyltransferase [Bacteroidetes bacterium]|nr:glycosyltransferase [Bacteroidota bacterium]